MKLSRPALFAALTFLAISQQVSCDDFTDLLQDLAMQTACLGMYSNAEAGNKDKKDPHDYYTPSMLAERFHKMSGERTRIQTFYGVCFDYAHAAWDDIKRYKSYYQERGMKGEKWYIAETHDNPEMILLFDPIGEDRVRKSGSGYIDIKDGKAVEKWNGVFHKQAYYAEVKAHKNTDGSRPTWHGWLWVQRTDGTWYWVDPTWTDNTGYPVYGIVQAGEEIPLTTKAKYCVVTPPAALREATALAKQDSPAQPAPAPAAAPATPAPQAAPQGTAPVYTCSARQAASLIAQAKALPNGASTTIKITGETSQEDLAALKAALKARHTYGYEHKDEQGLADLAFISLDLSEATGLAEIGDYAFYECYLLTGFVFPQGITQIGDFAFAWTKAFPTSITIPEGVQSIGKQAFYESGALGYPRSLYLPSSIQTIGYCAFFDKELFVDYGGSKAQWKQIDIDRSKGSNKWARKSTIYYKDE